MFHTFFHKVQSYKGRIRMHRKNFILYSALRILVILTAARCLYEGHYESFALCILSLLLFLLPSFFEEKLQVHIPPLFEAMIYLFIYAAEILGEVNKYYTTIPGWDTMLHTINGFLCAAIGFSLVDIMNRHSKHMRLSPAYVAMAAFCFSMTVGVMWEFFEYEADNFFFLDMQKDTIVDTIGSITLDETHSQIPVRISDIAETTITTSSGETYVIQGGYLDIGIHDTMKDLLVNFIGAVVFSIIGFLYERNRIRKQKGGKVNTIAASLIVTPSSPDSLENDS